MLTREKQIRIAAIIAIVLLLGALVLILVRFPEWQESRLLVALGIFASITSPIAVYEFLARRSHDPGESGGKSGEMEIQTGQTLEIGGDQQGTVTQNDQRGQTVEGPQTNIGNVQGHQFSGPIGTLNLSATAKSTPLASPWQIPLPPKDFTGRSKDIEDILADFQRGTTITGLRGMGGIGKTALALVLAQRLKDRFPDGQHFIDLKATSEKPLAASEAMVQVIRAHLGSDVRTPEGEAELAGLYRSVLEGKRALLLLDNAGSREQVEPLLPPEYCSVLITSRKKFALSGLKTLDLDPLSLEDARELLLAIDPQIGENADKLAELCGFLPITLKAAAYLLVETEDLAPAKYIEELSDERTRLKQLGRSGEDLDAEACFGLSYSRLPAKAARVFRLLSVFPADFDAKAEEAICLDVGHRILSELVHWNLVEYQRQKPEDGGRYHLHDLVRLFAARRQEEDGGADAKNEAMVRHAKYYKELLVAANDRYLKGGHGISAGLMLFDSEKANITAGQFWSAKGLERNSSAAEICKSYPDAGAHILDLRLHASKRIEWLENGLAAARRLKERLTEGNHLGNLGLAYYDLGDPRKAIEFYDQALAIASEIGDRRGEGNRLGNLGNAYSDLGDPQKAIEFHDQALAIAREIGNRRGEGAALGNLGLAYSDLGDPRKAIEFYDLALTIASEIGDRRGEGVVLGNLGLAFSDLGDPRKAIEFYEQQLAIAREIEDRRSEGNALWNLSLSLDKLGNRAKAIEYAKAALKIREEIEDPNAERVRRKLQEWDGS